MWPVFSWFAQFGEPCVPPGFVEIPQGYGSCSWMHISQPVEACRETAQRCQSRGSISSTLRKEGIYFARPRLQEMLRLHQSRTGAEVLQALGLPFRNVENAHSCLEDRWRTYHVECSMLPMRVFLATGRRSKPARFISSADCKNLSRAIAIGDLFP